jgi:hypothetical protein
MSLVICLHLPPRKKCSGEPARATQISVIAGIACPGGNISDNFNLSGAEVVSNG